MLIAAATKAPEDTSEAAAAVWDAYYGNHQKNSEFNKLRVADIFMGGGTTVVEGARLGMQMLGNDLNPVAWMVVTNELSDVTPDECQEAFTHIESVLRPQIIPYYACECPRGCKGVWTDISNGEPMPENFDPLALPRSERANYSYYGPEVIYTFWSKHGPCTATGVRSQNAFINHPCGCS